MATAVAPRGVQLLTHADIVDHLEQDGVNQPVGAGVEQAAEGATRLAQRSQQLIVIGYPLGHSVSLPHFWCLAYCDTDGSTCYTNPTIRGLSRATEEKMSETI